MSTFEVQVHKIQTAPHTGADNLEIATFENLDYTCVVQKGLYKTGDLVVYIPEAAIVPPPLLEEMGLVGKLAGPNNDRVKAIRLRGVFSQGLVYPAREGWSLGQDVASELGITKYVPEVAPQFRGSRQTTSAPIFFKYDLENIKNRPHQIPEGTEVHFTEKVHGTWSVFGAMPDSLKEEVGPLIVSSKGLFNSGVLLKMDNTDNIYVKFAKDNDVENKIRSVFHKELEQGLPVYVMGELFGPVQDLKYGGDLQYRIFDIYIGLPRQGGRFVDSQDLGPLCDSLGFSRVPLLYSGPLTKEALAAHTSGKETISGKGLHIREGVVVCTATEQYHPRYGRCKLKSISPDYLLRKNGTEME